MKTEDIKIKNIELLDNIRADTNENMAELMEDIKQHGLLHPIGIYKQGRQFVLAYGFRRLNACKKLGWKTIPAVLYDKILSEDDFLTINASENIHRKDITPIELGRVCQRLKDIGLSIEEIASRLSVPKCRVDTCLRLYVELPKAYRNSVKYIVGKTRKGKLPATLVNQIVCYRALNAAQKEQMLSFVKIEDMSTQEVSLVLTLISQGLTIRQAVNERKNYICKNMKHAFIRSKVEKIEKTQKFGRYIKDLFIKEGLI